MEVGKGIGEAIGRKKVVGVTIRPDGTGFRLSYIGQVADDA